MGDKSLTNKYKRVLFRQAKKIKSRISHFFLKIL